MNYIQKWHVMGIKFELHLNYIWLQHIDLFYKFESSMK